ncbi:hypothetical protein HGRIS_005740 [Hohenbuehelia grisea]|uniref:Protein kinase domain-containing protein n=1 Tax=Hohenbuehelia grisea TaxID=104357 RepID=A0ABR3JYN0_9AGAR
MSNDARPPRVLANWYLSECLGSGYSGSIYRAQHVHSGRVVALKVQNVDHECPTNRYERRFYPALQGGEGMPLLYAAGVEGDWDYLAIELLGPSLDSLLRKSGQDAMDLRSVCCIAMQVISRLEIMHARGILHRDIQLGNCTIGLAPNDKKIYMIDFGFSKQYIDPYTRRHIPDSKAKRDFIGNYWFSSIGVHCKGKVPSRRDDMEAAALMFIHLLTPRGLPWTRNGVPKTDDAHARLKQAKRHARPEDLCRDIPSEFEEFLRYCRRLKFEEQPDYAQWREEFRSLAVEQGFPNDDAFVWPPPPIPEQNVYRSPTKTPRRTPAPMDPDDMEDILRGLGNLDLGGQRVVLGDRQNIANGVRAAQQGSGKKPGALIKPKPKQNIIISINSSSEGSQDSRTPAPPVRQQSKALQLSQLRVRVGDARDNAALGQAVLDFVGVMRGCTSKNLTKEGFAFLDALHKKLADPEAFAQPMRTSRSRTSSDRATDPLRPQEKLSIVRRLNLTVQQAKSSQALAKMVTEFGTVTNRSTGRTITKDGFAFFEGLATKLRTLQ